MVVLIAFGIGSRGGDGEDVPPDTGEPTATVVAEARTDPSGPAPTVSGVSGTPGAGPVSVGGVTVGEVVWATAVDPVTQAPAEPRETIGDDAGEIYAVVPVTGLPAGATVAATWTYNGATLDALGTAVTAESATAQTWVAFRIDRVETATPLPRSEEDWPDGDYGVVITIDGQIVQQATVVVEETF